MRRRMKRLLVVLSAGLLLVFGAIPVQAEEWSVSAECAVVMEAESGRILFAKNEDRVRSMASTTKILTGLLAIESEQMDDVVTVTAEMLQTEGSSIYLQEGDRLTLRALVYGLMLESGNDAANAIAITVGGDLERFASRMNARASALGMQSTHFITPSGLDAEGHQTTARDLAVLACAAIQNPEFRAIVSQRSAEVDWVEPAVRRTFFNHNRLLREMDGCIGVKTGYTKKSGRCLVTACERNGIVLVAVTLNAPDDWNDHKKMMDYGYSQVEMVQLDSTGLDVRVPVVGGVEENILLNDAAAIRVVIPNGRSSEITMRVEVRPFLYAPLKNGDYAGRVVYRLDGKEIAEIPLTVSQDVAVVRREWNALERIWKWIRTCFGFGL